MKPIPSSLIPAFLAAGLLAATILTLERACAAEEKSTVEQNPPPPSTFCRFVPERMDDFAWENDLVAFRAYGPALSKGSENSGIDCWAKRVTYPIIDKWYRLDLKEKLSYHNDHGEGNDFYHVGKSRGCGGTAIWYNGAMVLSGVYKQWKILESGTAKSVFQLSYEYDLEGRKISEVKTITVELGKRLFKSESAFTENGKPADLEIAAGITTHNQHGKVTMNREAGWMSVWEEGLGGFGTAVVMDAKRITGMQEIKTNAPDESHVILTTHTDAGGRTVHYAGFAWGKAGGITTPEQWQDYLSKFSSTLKTE